MGHNKKLLTREESFLKLVIKIYEKQKILNFVHFSDILTGDQIAVFVIFQLQSLFTILFCLPPN